MGDSFYCTHISGCQRLPGGNTLITMGPQGMLVEVTPGGQQVGALKRVILSRFSRIILVGTWEIEQEKAHKSRKYHHTTHKHAASSCLSTTVTVRRCCGYPAVPLEPVVS